MSKITGAQLYTIRDFLQTPEAINDSFKKIKDIGYTTVQASGFGPIPADELSAIARTHDLKIVITHTPYSKFIEDLEGFEPSIHLI
jgi:sugar phosphate isomerase/epimerase